MSLIRPCSVRKASGSAPIVVKLGGSLLPHLADLVPLLASSRPLLVIPGGGPFADEVRLSSTDGDTAHWMAIAAMDQYGWLIASHGLPVTARISVPHRPAVLLPYCSTRKIDPLPHSWDVTSDSVAAWVARTLNLELLVLKSVDGIMNGGLLEKTVCVPVPTSVVDPFFIPYVLAHGIPVTVVNGTIAARVARFLKGRQVPGTRIGRISTTF